MQSLNEWHFDDEAVVLGHWTAVLNKDAICADARDGADLAFDG